jgi:glycosyltransferase involved in cell wall biosynthesis
VKLAIITSHPIQYNAPIFQMLASRGHIKVKVFYTWGEEVMRKKYDPGFDRDVQWDIPLLDGYEFEWVLNVSREKGTHHFRGIITPKLSQSIESWGADGLLVFGWNLYGHLTCMRHFKGKIPVFFRGDSTLLNRNVNSIKEKAKAEILRWVYKHVDAAFYVGEENKKYFQHYGLKEKQLIYAPHAVDNDRFGKEVAALYREHLKIADDYVVYLYAGKFEQIKNLFFLIDSFYESAQNNPLIYLLLAGTGKLENDLLGKVKSFPENIQKRIHFCGFVNQQQMPLLYASSDVYVLSSISETWGLSVNEAMASGKAVIISDGCGCATDLVDNAVNGFIFTLKESGDLIKKMGLILDRNFANKLGYKSLEKIKNYNMLIFVEALEKAILYES